jgi:hypothetical protein
MVSEVWDLEGRRFWTREMPADASIDVPRLRPPDRFHLRILAGYFDYYNRSRCHLSLVGDAPEPRHAQGPELGRVVELPEAGGLHHRYERAAA